MNLAAIGECTEKSRRAGVKRAAIASRRLVRVSGEVMTLGAAAIRAGMSHTSFVKWYGRGVRTWEGFANRLVVHHIRKTEG